MQEKQTEKNIQYRIKNRKLDHNFQQYIQSDFLRSKRLYTEQYNMARVAKTYPRATLRRTLKKHTGQSIGKDVDILLYLDYVLFMQEVMSEAGMLVKRRGERAIGARDIARVTEGCLRKFKG